MRKILRHATVTHSSKAGLVSTASHTPPVMPTCSEALHAVPICCATTAGSLCSARCSPLVCKGRHFTTMTPARYQSWARNVMRPWMCPAESCHAVNSAVKTECQSCGAEKPKLQGWKCVKCSSRNHRGVKTCKQCKEPFSTSKDFWMCAVCHENNRIDEIEDNSRCGHCGYDMAPLTLAEARIAELNDQREAEHQAQQERFDSIGAREAEEQFGDPLDGAQTLPPHLQGKSSLGGARVVASRLASIPKISPFTPQPVQTRHSRIYSRRPARGSAAIVAAAATGTVGAVMGDAIPPGPPGFDWMCRERSCGCINPGDEENCMSCGVHIAPAEWECPQCAALNHLSRSRCFNCHAGIPVYWTCSACQATTSVYDKECRQCHEPRPAAEPRDVRDIRAEERAREQSSGAGPSFRRNDWYCTSCNGLNFARRTECYQCGTIRPASAGIPSGNRSFSREDEANDGGSFTAPHRRVVEQNNWICRHCQASNFRTRRSCWQCDKESPAAADGGGAFEDERMPHFEREGFQDAAESKPAEGRMNVWKKTDDWVCAKCFSKNHRGRGDCFKCGASRSLAVSPKRANVRKPVKL